MSNNQNGNDDQQGAPSSAADAYWLDVAAN